MQILSVGDAHITGKNPIARIDDLTETQYEKWEEIRDYANAKNVPIVSSGDIFNVSVVANSVKSKFGGIISTLKNPLYFVWGNHDLLYHALKIWDRTSLGVMLKNNPKVKHISSFEEDYGVAWDWIDWDTPLKSNGARFLLSHKAIISNKQMDASFWIGRDKSFAMTVGKWSENYRIIQCGHWHKQYSFKSGKTIVINPGPVSRINTEDNLHPSICLINLDTGVFRRYSLQSAKPFEEVISNKHIIRKENNSENIKRFLSSIDKSNSRYGSSFMENIMNIVESHELDKEMEELLIDILSKSREKKNK